MIQRVQETKSDVILNLIYLCRKNYKLNGGVNKVCVSPFLVTLTIAPMHGTHLFYLLLA